jgi:hypothetical protein
MEKIASVVIAVGILLMVTGQSNAAGTTDGQPLAALPLPVSADDLSKMSGGASPTGVAVTTQTLSALNSGNSVNASSVVTGEVNLQPGTFSGFNGIGNFVFNTGNNNNVQGTLSVTILTPPLN